MKISEPLKFRDLLAKLADPSEVALFAERDGTRLDHVSGQVIKTIVIGPEGGWSDAEMAAAQRSGRILRAETAAIAITAIVQNLFGDIN